MSYILAVLLVSVIIFHYYKVHKVKDELVTMKAKYESVKSYAESLSQSVEPATNSKKTRRVAKK